MKFSTNLPSSLKEYNTLKPLKPNVEIKPAATEVQNNWNVGVCYRCQGPISNAPFVERGHQVVSRLDANYKVKEKYSFGNLYCSRECRDGIAPTPRLKRRCKNCNLRLPSDARKNQQFCDSACKKAKQRSTPEAAVTTA